MKVVTSHAPHIRCGITTRAIMIRVSLSLVPMIAASALIFGARALLLFAVSVVSCVLFELLFELATHRDITVSDFSAVVTGILLAAGVPVGIPIWQLVVGAAAAIVLVKEIFGGIGKNFANPAATARIIMFLSFSESMTAWVKPNFVDTVSSATPLSGMASGSEAPSLLRLFLGLRGGCIGETCIAALLLGGIYLLCTGIISWHAPASYIATVFVISALLGRMPIRDIMSGSVILAAFYMATDYSTTPTTGAGKIVFGAVCGAITMLIRAFGSYPEGVSFALLFANILTPYISSLTPQKVLGGESSLGRSIIRNEK